MFIIDVHFGDPYVNIHIRMNVEIIFRAIFWILLFGLWVMRIFFMRQSRSVNKRPQFDRNAVEQEGRWLFLGRTIASLFLALILVLYAYNSSWLETFAIVLPEWLRWGGVILGLVGFGLWTWTQAVLGKEYSPLLQVGDQHRLVTIGPYARIRHPMYTAMSAVAIALALLSANWCFVLFAIALVIGFVLRAPREEQMMQARFGNTYAEYMKKTGRFFPRWHT
jgi:protein-S-isoprenylcysteine O-methyltransferase Ste14